MGKLAGSSLVAYGSKQLGAHTVKSFVIYHPYPGTSWEGKESQMGEQEALGCICPKLFAAARQHIGLCMIIAFKCCYRCCA